MSAITIGTTGTQFGILQAETGVIVQSVDRASQRQKREAMDQSGNIVAVGYYAPKAVYSVNGILLWPTGLSSNSALSGVSGLAASAYPGGVVALANVLNDGGSGVSGGHVYCEEMTTRQTNTNFIDFSGTFTQYPSITSP